MAVTHGDRVAARKLMFAAADIVAIHEAALEVLARTGVVVMDDDAVALLKAAGVRADGRRMFITADQVERALASAPSAFTLAGRHPERDLRFGESRPVFGSGSGPAYVLDGTVVRPGTLADAQAAVKLGHLSRGLEFNSDCIEPLDLPEDERTRRSDHARLTLSDKSMEWTASQEPDVDEAVAINEILYGPRWEERPRALIVLNTNSPLLLSVETSRILRRWAGLGQPACVTACVMGGATGPATPAGALTVQHAEVLAALVLGQTAREGSPFIYGGVSTMSSMRTGAAQFGTPEFATMAAATVRLAHHAGLPVRAGAAVTDAHVPDAQAALESSMGLWASVSAGGDFLFQAAGILSSFNVLSLEKFVLDDELICALRLMAAATAADSEALAAEVIAAVGPGGDYLGQTHTRRHGRDLDRPTFLVRESAERWRAEGEADVRAAAAAEVERRLAAHEPPDDIDAVTRRQLDEYCLS